MPVKGATALLATAGVIAACGLGYELLASAIASWVLGDAVTQFSVVVGLYLSALGLGALVSSRIRSSLATHFVLVEIAVACVGGMLAPALFVTFAEPRLFRATLYMGVVLCGMLVGLEVPLLTRVLRSRADFQTAVARVFAYDHAGSLAGALVFSLWLMPRVGPLRAGLLFGIVNATVAFASTYLLRSEIRSPRWLRAGAVCAAALLAVVYARSARLIHAVDGDAPRAPSGANSAAR